MTNEPWDIEHGQLSGDPVPVPGARIVSYVSAFGRASLLVSNDGTILFGTGSDHFQVTWLNREGKTPTALFGVSEPQGVFSYRYDVSSDDQRVLALVPGQVAGDAASLSLIINWDAKFGP